MRRLYLDLVARRLRRGDVAFPFRALRSVLGAVGGEARPVLGTLVVTYRCDLACGMCDLPLRGDRTRELATDGMLGIVDALKDLGVLGVGITGGEPLLRKDLFAIAGHAARRGLLVHVNTNGTLVDAAAPARFADADVASVNLSLDGPTAAVHDRLRGRQGSFARVLAAAARLVAHPRRPYRVALTCALGEENAEDADALLERARDLGVDRVGFLPVHAFPASRVAPAGGRGAAAALRLRQRAGRDPLLDNSAAYLGLFGRAYAGEDNPVPCTAARTSIVVDCYGEVFPCVPLQTARRPVGRGDPRRVWRSEAYARMRRSLRTCRACYWNCHTELNLALRRLGARA